MHLPGNFIRSVLILTAAILIGGTTLSAQAPPASGEESYEATLFVLVGSDDTSQGGELPRSLDAVSKRIRENFTFRSYRLVNTYYGRLANSGSLDYKSVSSLKSLSTQIDSPTFLDWHLARFQTDPTSRGDRRLALEMFRFGARVPLAGRSIQGPGGTAVPVTNYESVGLTLNKLRLDESRPTLIGTISLPRATGTIFLVMTISPVS